jgi:hypothetical protein
MNVSVVSPDRCDTVLRISSERATPIASRSWETVPIPHASGSARETPHPRTWDALQAKPAPPPPEARCPQPVVTAGSLSLRWRSTCGLVPGLQLPAAQRRSRLTSARHRARPPPRSMRPVTHPQPAHVPSTNLERSGIRGAQAATPVNTIHVASTALEIEAHGVPKGWQIRQHLSIPLKHVLHVSHDPASADEPDALAPDQRGTRRWIGMFMDAKQRSFWNIDGHGRTLVIETTNGYFERLFLTVADSDEMVRTIRCALDPGHGQR